VPLVDYALDRLAFRDPADISKLPRAVEIPVNEWDAECAVPLSIKGAGCG
jgi:hypothetical protein